MSPRYQFVSPGAAAGAGLLEVLSKQSEDRRRAMLDEITAKNAESNRAMTAEHIAASQADREQQLLNSAESGWSADQDISGVDPAILSAAERRGHVNKHSTPVPNVSTSMSDVAPADWVGDDTATQAPPPDAPAPEPPASIAEGKYFAGSKDDRNVARKRAKALAIFEQLKQPGLSQTEKAGLMFQLEAEGVNGDSPAMGRLLADKPVPQPLRRFSQDTGAMDDILDKQGKPVMAQPGQSPIMNWTRPPRPPHETGSIYGPAKDASGADIPGKVVMVQNGQLRIVDLPTGVAGVSKTPPGGPGKAGRGAVPAAIANALTTAMGKTGKPGGAEAIAQAQENYISSYGTTPDVKDTIRDIIYRPDEKRSRAELIQDHADAFTRPDGSVDDKQLSEFADLLGIVRGS